MKDDYVNYYAGTLTPVIADYYERATAERLFECMRLNPDPGFPGGPELTTTVRAFLGRRKNLTDPN